MIALKLILEGLGLGFLLYLICAIGIRNGAVGMVICMIKLCRNASSRWA